MSLNILSTVWGEKHIELFRRSTLKSLSFDNNLQALGGVRAKWNIFTEPQYAEYLKSITKVMEGVDVRIRSTVELRRYTDTVHSALILQMEECLKEEAPFLIAPPDTIFGDGSIHAMLDIGTEPGACVAIHHPRVLPSILEHLNESLPNAKLVTLAWEHLHRSWTDAEIGHKRNNSFVGGVAWKKIAASTYAIKHRLPTIYLANFLQEDLDYFKVQISSGHWDHVWPKDLVFPKGRQRTLGSSDAAFILEITEFDKNVPPLWDGPKDGLSFWQKHEHNQINSQFISIFRGE